MSDVCLFKEIELLKESAELPGRAGHPDPSQQRLLDFGLCGGSQASSHREVAIEPLDLTGHLRSSLSLRDPHLSLEPPYPHMP